MSARTGSSSSKPRWSGKPLRALTACTTPEVELPRHHLGHVHVGAFLSFGLTQRMKCVFVCERAHQSSSDLRNESITPTNLADLNCAAAERDLVEGWTNSSSCTA